MGSKARLSSQGFCMLCVRPINPTLNPNHFLLRPLSSYLGLDCGKLFDYSPIPMTVDGSLALMGKLQGSEVLLPICHNCSKLTVKFDRLHKELERITVELNHVALDMCEVVETAGNHPVLRVARQGIVGQEKLLRMSFWTELLDKGRAKNEMIVQSQMKERVQAAAAVPSTSSASTRNPGLVFQQLPLSPSMGGQSGTGVGSSSSGSIDEADVSANNLNGGDGLGDGTVSDSESSSNEGPLPKRSKTSSRTELGALPTTQKRLKVKVGRGAPRSQSSLESAEDESESQSQEQVNSQSAPLRHAVPSSSSSILNWLYHVQTAGEIRQSQDMQVLMAREIDNNDDVEDEGCGISRASGSSCELIVTSVRTIQTRSASDADVEQAGTAIRTTMPLLQDVAAAAGPSNDTEAASASNPVEQVDSVQAGPSQAPSGVNCPVATCAFQVRDKAKRRVTQMNSHLALYHADHPFRDLRAPQISSEEFKQLCADVLPFRFARAPGFTCILCGPHGTYNLNGNGENDSAKFKVHLFEEHRRALATGLADLQADPELRLMLDQYRQDGRHCPCGEYLCTEAIFQTHVRHHCNQPNIKFEFHADAEA